MNNSNSNESNYIQKILTINPNHKKLSKIANNTQNAGLDMYENNTTVNDIKYDKNAYNDINYDGESVYYMPDRQSEEEIKGKNITIQNNDNILVNNSHYKKIPFTPNNNYNNLNSSTIDRELRNDNYKIHNFGMKDALNMNYPTISENYRHLDMQTILNNYPNVHSLPYNSVRNSQFIYPESIPSLYERTNNMQKTDFFKTNSFNPYLEKNPFIKRINPQLPIHYNEVNSSHNPTVSTYGNAHSYINYEHLPNTRPQVYYLIKDENNCSLLKKGIDYAMRACKPNIDKSHIQKYEYIIQGPKLPCTNYPNQNKIDVFKKLTLSIGACLDDVVNMVIYGLGSSFKSVKKSNEDNLYDLYPFYNPDPNYSRQERPTLKTGSNLIDKINCALDGTTLEKHKNIPKEIPRIAIPETEKTGQIVVDGINGMLDNLLNDPLSYKNYDYFSNKHSNVTKLGQNDSFI